MGDIVAMQSGSPQAMGNSEEGAAPAPPPAQAAEQRAARATVRALLRDQIGTGQRRGLKSLLAAAPLEGSISPEIATSAGIRSVSFLDTTSLSEVRKSLPAASAAAAAPAAGKTQQYKTQPDATACILAYGVLAQRNPTRLLRLVGVLLPRQAARRLGGASVPK
jgi:hypothetical protein